MESVRTAARASAGDDGRLGPRRRPGAQDPGQDDPQAHAGLGPLARAPAQRSLRRPGAPRRLPGARGGWSQVAATRVGAHEGRGRVLAIDLLALDPIEGVEFRQMDFHDRKAPDQLREWLGGPADGVLFDMAANATGHRKTDQLRIMGLVELAADFASEVLAPGGFFLAKVLQGGAEGELLARLKRDFASVRHLKPKASRADSAELYLLATGFRGVRPEPAPN